MPIARLKRFLDDRKIKYVTIAHSPAYTARDVADAAHIPPKELAKTVMVKLDGRMVMAVVPASHVVDLDLFARRTGARAAVLANEAEFEDLFPGCEVGAMPPFGHLWGLPVFVSHALADDEQIAFNAGNHTEVMLLDFVDFVRSAEPKMLDFSRPS